MTKTRASSLVLDFVSPWQGWFIRKAKRKTKRIRAVFLELLPSKRHPEGYHWAVGDPKERAYDCSKRPVHFRDLLIHVNHQLKRLGLAVPDLVWTRVGPEKLILLRDYVRCEPDVTMLRVAETLERVKQQKSPPKDEFRLIQQHDDLPELLKEKIRLIHRVIGRYVEPFEQFEFGFCMDMNPEKEVSVWWWIALAWLSFHRRYLQEKLLPDALEEKIVAVLVGYSMGIRKSKCGQQLAAEIMPDFARRLWACYDNPFIMDAADEQSPDP